MLDEQDIPEEQDKNDGDLTVQEILDLLEQKVWTYVGEVKNLVHPNDGGRLAELTEACDRRLALVEDGPRREGLRLIRKRLDATARLNSVLSMSAFGVPILPTKTIDAPLPFEHRTIEPESVEPRAMKSRAIGPRRRKPTRRLTSAKAMPGFENYHRKILMWLDEKNLSQSSLAQFLTIDPSYLSRAIRGERQNRDLFLKIEELTGISAPIKLGESTGAKDKSSRSIN